MTAELPRRRATPAEAEAIRRALDLTARIRELCERRDRAFAAAAASASPDEILILEVEVEGLAEVRAVRIGRPRGKFVVFPELGFVVNRAATAEDRRALPSAPGG